MYEALYRKYRPRTFDEVVGQEYITETLKNQVRTGRLSHAYLFIGTRGTGKTTCARILAKAVNCEHPVNGNPCNQCPSCRGIEDGSILDIVELDAASNNGVDDVRMLRDEAVFSPTTVKKRVYIIDEVHMLSKSAFNALLKILEEPPAHLMFILATTELNKVLPTILSRCQRHSFRRLDSDTIAKRLLYVAQQENIRLEPDAAQLLGRLADGGMRDGLSLLDQCAASETVDTASVLHAMGLAGSFRIQELTESILSGQLAPTLEQYNSLWQDGKDPAALLGELAGFFRDALLLRLAPEGGRGLISGAYGEEVLQSVRLSDSGLLWTLNTIQKYQSAMSGSTSPRLQGELCMIELCGVRPQAVAAAEAPAQPVPERPASVRTAAPIPAAPPREPEKTAARPAPVQSAPTPTEETFVPQPKAAPSMPRPTEEKPSVPAPVPESGGEFRWTEAVKALRTALKPGQYNLVSDPAQTKGELVGEVLTLYLAEGLCYMVVNTPEVINAIRQGISHWLGRSIQVRVETLKNDPQKVQDKLDMLGRQFSNVTIR